MKWQMMGLFATKTDEQLQTYIESISHPQEKALAWTIYGLTYNMCAKAHNDSLEEENGS